MNDTSRTLRYELGTICERYNVMIADKDAIDVRLGSPEPYGETSAEVSAERVYEVESHTIGGDLRALIAQMHELAQRIREIEGF